MQNGYEMEVSLMCMQSGEKKRDLDDLQKSPRSIVDDK